MRMRRPPRAGTHLPPVVMPEVMSRAAQSWAASHRRAVRATTACQHAPPAGRTPRHAGQPHGSRPLRHHAVCRVHAPSCQPVAARQPAHHATGQSQ